MCMLELLETQKGKYMAGILIVEDDSNIAEILKENILRMNSGHTIYEAADPIEALTLYKNNKFKIKYLVCDYLLPIQNGRDFIDIVREYSPQIKICVFTGDSAITKKDLINVDELFYKHDGIDQVLTFLKS
jgi:CheY-like chemotaxis protein